MAIAHVNNGAESHGGFSATTSVTLALPASIATGNLLIGHVSVRRSVPIGAITWPAGWTEIDSQVFDGGNGKASVAYRIASGSDTAPVVTHFDGVGHGVICQFSGAQGIGNSAKGTATASTTAAVAAITSSADNSVAIYLHSTIGSTSQYLPTPSGWSQIVAHDESSSLGTSVLDFGTKALGASGSSSGAISETVVSSTWSLFNIEITAATVAEGTSAVTLGDIAGSASASSGNSSVVTLGDIAGSASAITGAGGSSIVALSAITGGASAIGVADVSVDSGVSVVTGLIGEPLRLAFADSAVLASSSASSPVTLVVLADSSVLAVHAASAYRLLDAAVDSNSALSSSAPVAAVYSVAAASLCSVLTGLQFVADFTDGWAYNLNTGAGSFYEGFRFNSFALIDGEYYGANEAGIFRLGGDADDSAPIDMTITLGTSNLGSSRVKRVPAAYVGAQSDQPLVLTCRVEGLEYSYTFSRATATMAPAKVQIGKGLAGVYWQLEMSNTAGADAEIDALELLVAHSDRRRV